MRMPRNLSLLLPPLLFDFGDCESDRRREAPFLGLLDRVEWNGSFALESFFGESRALFVFFVISLEYFSMIGQLLGPAIIVTGEK